MTDIKPALKDYIKVYESVVPNELCDLVLGEYQTTDLWEKTRIGQDEIDDNVRSCQRIQISTVSSIAENSEKRTLIDQRLCKSALDAIVLYNKDFPYCIANKDCGYDLLRYETGQFYTQHTDSYEKFPREISCSFSLNSGYEGGEFAFFDREVVIKLPKGSALIFPSNFLYPHEVMPVTKGTRYSIVTWYT
jgi:predicted 2-oxoglutarate/Fe(II)-dependent dioxygenase YbiX